MKTRMTCQVVPFWTQAGNPHRFHPISIALLLAVAGLNHPSKAQTTELISRLGAPRTSASGNDTSGSPILNSNGRFVLFASAARNLVTNRVSGLPLDYYLRDRIAGTTTLVTVNMAGSGGANRQSLSADMSDDGRYVVFQSNATNLVEGDIRENADVFLRDVQSGKTILVSHVNGGSTPALGESTDPVISADGRYIAYQSTASNIVTNDDNSLSDVFVYDRETGANLLLSRQGGSTVRGWADNPAISGDGRVVAFAASGTNLVNGRTLSGSSREVYAFDRSTGLLHWASTNALKLAGQFGAFSNTDSFMPTLSSNGRYLVFHTAGTSTNPGLLMTLRYEFATQSTEIIQADRSSPTLWQEDSVDRPLISSSGRFVLYRTSTNLVLWDAQTASNQVVNLQPDGMTPAGGQNFAPSMSDDGRFISFLSESTNLAPNIPDGYVEIYLRDMTVGATILVSTNRQGQPLTGLYFSYPILSADGNVLVFESPDETVVTGDGNHLSDVFLRQTASGVIQLVSSADSGVALGSATGFSLLSSNSISADGRYLVFQSDAVDLVPGISHNPASGYTLFVHDLQDHTTIAASVAADGVTTANASCTDPVLSADGRFLAFVSRASNLVTNDTNQVEDVFIRDLQTGVTSLVSVNRTGTQSGNGASTRFSLSADGNYALFQSLGTDLVAQPLGSSGNHVFLRDLKNKTTRLVDTTLAGTSSGNAEAVDPVLSNDGRFAAFASRASNLVSPPPSTSVFNYYVADLISGRIVQTPVNSGSSSIRGPYAFSTRDSLLLYRGNISASTSAYYLFDPASRANQFVCTNCANAAASADALSVVYQGTKDAKSQVYLLDRAVNKSWLISSRDGTTPGNGNSYNPLISPNGRYIVFESKASDLGTDDNTFTDVYIYDRTDSRLSLVSGADAGRASGQSVSANPSFSQSGRIIVFQSFSANLVPDDRNQSSDVFAWHLPPSPLAPSQDSDADGLEDAWEIRNFGSLDANPWEDADGDGVSNFLEYTASTAPSLKVVGVTLAGNTLRISWSSAPGQRYQIQFKESLQNANWNRLPTDFTATGSITDATDAPAGAQRFYRVVLVP